MESVNLIGQLVISSTFGLGHIVEIEKFDYDSRSFFIIECQNKKVKHFIPTDDRTSYRMISSQEVISKVLKKLSTNLNKTSYKSKKERMNHFKTQSQIQEVHLLGDLLNELDTFDDRGILETQIHNRLVETLALEYSTIKNFKLKDARHLIIRSLLK